MAVNKAGPSKTIKQGKDKLRNLKQAYKDAKGNNSQMGRANKTSPFFDLFEEVLGCRPVVKMPGVIQSCSDSNRSESPSSSAKSSRIESSDSDVDAADLPPNQEANKRKKVKPEPPKKKAKRSKDSSEMQNEQVKAIERSQTRSEELMLKLEIKQRKIDEESRRDQEFFLRMAELLKK